MIRLLILASGLMATGCVSSSEFNEEEALAKCRSLPVVTYRDRCIAETLAQSERERQYAKKAAQKETEVETEEDMPE